MVVPAASVIDWPSSVWRLPVPPRSVGYPIVLGAAHAAVVCQQYWPVPQVTVCPGMHPCALAVQDSDVVSLLQVLPVLLPHPPVGGGQTQATLVPEVPQTSPVAAQLVSA